MKVAILDCYVDEPACLGVPPYISPYPRYVAGAIADAGHEHVYLTIDDYRRGSPKVARVRECGMLVAIGGAIVPGKYLRGMPASTKELAKIALGFGGKTVLGGPLAKFSSGNNIAGMQGRKSSKNRYFHDEPDLSECFDELAKGDVDCAVYDLLNEGKFYTRTKTQDEWDRWALLGSAIVKEHPDFPKPLIVEIDTYRGCVRYFSGGCSFCTEPLYGMPKFRSVSSILHEVEALGKLGIVNFRIGAQTCIFCYGVDESELGRSETPKPNVDAVRALFSGIRQKVPSIEVLHVDNSNPAVIASHPEESKEILRILVEYCTPGNVLAFGLESADPQVAKENNLNASAEQAMHAIELVNKLGCARGANGMPNLLPGINLLSGLKGETKETFELDFAFLKNVLEKGLMLRRINIRQVAPIRAKFDTEKHHREFERFKERVRNEIDGPMLHRVVPAGTVMKDVYAEVKIGGITFGRQIGSYPLLVGIPYDVPVERFYSLSIVGHGQRSVTGVEYPLSINRAPLKAIESLPGIGAKRAARIVRSRPFDDIFALKKCLDEPALADALAGYIKFDKRPY